MFQPIVILEQLAGIRESVTDVVDADFGSRVDLGPIGIEHRHVCERKAMVLVIVSEKGERRVLILHLRLKDGLVPRQHFCIASGHINNVR